VIGNDVGRRVYVRVQGEAFELWVDGIPFSVYVAPADQAGYQAPKSVGEDRFHGGRVRALMPGRITSVLVKETDRVEIGSPLLILEAMKMQNEIVSHVAGTVKSIHVKEGETVRKEALLVEID
jgi:biotin carboxyl carrier protein